jgi:phage terminase large subunit-like protein
VIIVGRGAGKNGFLAFEDFALLTPVNGVPKYHIDIFATSEDQAKQSFLDVYDVLEQNAVKMKRHFNWNKEVIKNLKTGSELRFRTSNAKTKDGGRPGKVDFDEYHAYENSALIDVAVTGLGKKRYPRQTIISTNGNVRGAVFDDLLETCEKILDLEEPDNGTFPFICKIDCIDEIDNPDSWHKANPSLRFLPDLMEEIKP